MNWQLEGRVLGRVRRSDVLEVRRIGGTDPGVVLAGLGQAETPVRASSYLVGVVFVLAVVLPEADVADLVAAPFAEGQEAAARAGVRTGLVVTDDVDERLSGHVAHGHICNRAEVAG